MRKSTKTTATETAVAVAPVTETAVAAPVAVAELSPRQAAKLAHDNAGFFGTVYRGLSKTRNAGVAKAPDTSTSKASKRDFASLTPRMLATLRELATRYGDAAFPLIGIDRGQAAIFLNSGFFLASGDDKARLHYAPAPAAKTDASGKSHVPAFYHVPDTFKPKA